MGSCFIVPLMASLWLGGQPTVDRPLLSISPDAKVTLRHVKLGAQSFMKVEAAGVTFESARLRVQLDGKAIDLDSVVEGIRLESEDGSVGIFTERTIVGGTKKKD